MEESHFMWAFSHSAFVFGAAKVGVPKLIASPSPAARACRGAFFVRTCETLAGQAVCGELRSDRWPRDTFVLDVNPDKKGVQSE